MWWKPTSAAMWGSTTSGRAPYTPVREESTGHAKFACGGWSRTVAVMLR